MKGEWIVWILFVTLIPASKARHGIFRFRRHLQQEDSAKVGTNLYHHSFSLETNLFNQTLDHFTPSDNRTWQQRYWCQSNFYSPGGPVFLQLDGEWLSDDRELTYGLIEVHAINFSALVFQLEHRFYGKSIPTSDLRVSNLKYLKIDQALADAANFIKAMNQQYDIPEETKWIVFGGSYAGNIATWLRLKYPDLVYAAVASSAPLLAKLDYSDFLEETKESLAQEGGDECVGAISEAVQEMEQLLLSSSGQNKLIKIFGLCGQINASNVMDRADFFSAVGERLPLIVMNAPKYIVDFCSVMVNKSYTDIVQRYSTACNMFGEPGPDCINIRYVLDVQQLRSVYLPDDTWTERQWAWQLCSELGLFQTSKTPDALLGANLPLRFYIRQCRDIFGKGFTRKSIQENVYRTNREYGGTGLNVTRVLHVHGSLDPWSSLGVTVQTNPESPVIVIKGASHCTWDETPNSSDSAALIDGRTQITQVISKWLDTKD